MPTRMWRVRGKAEVSHVCSCDYCLGHERIREVDVDVEAETEQEASDKALQDLLELEEGEETAEWMEKAVVEEVGEVPMEVQMERLGAPRLF